ASVPVKEKVTSGPVIAPGPLSITVSGLLTSTVQAYCAGVESVSVSSMARTRKTWEPSTSPLAEWGEVQGRKPPSSTRHSKVALGREASNWKTTSEPDGLLG